MRLPKLLWGGSLGTQEVAQPARWISKLKSSRGGQPSSAHMGLHPNQRGYGIENNRMAHTLSDSGQRLRHVLLEHLQNGPPLSGNCAIEELNGRKQLHNPSGPDCGALPWTPKSPTLIYPCDSQYIGTNEFNDFFTKDYWQALNPKTNSQNITPTLLQPLACPPTSKGSGIPVEITISAPYQDYR